MWRGRDGGMTEAILVAVLSLAGTPTGSVAGVLAANRVTTYRIEELEKKVDKHNNLVERTVVLERDMSAAFRELDKLK